MIYFYSNWISKTTKTWKQLSFLGNPGLQALIRHARMPTFHMQHETGCANT